MGLRIREGWKYERLRVVLGDRPHEFEYPVKPYIFDLALFDTRILVEFDGPYHGGQVAADQEKDLVGIAAGFSVVRRVTPPATVIDPAVLDGL